MLFSHIFLAIGLFGLPLAIAMGSEKIAKWFDSYKKYGQYESRHSPSAIYAGIEVRLEQRARLDIAKYVGMLQDYQTYLSTV